MLNLHRKKTSISDVKLYSVVTIIALRSVGTTKNGSCGGESAQTELADGVHLPASNLRRDFVFQREQHCCRRRFLRRRPS